MKSAPASNPVEIGGAEEKPQSFKINPSREAFDILSSKLYNDKISAVIRELSTNAYDSHVAANKKDTPIEVHLPTSFEPYFSVKDYGVGLTNEEIMELYCTYFSSNRNDSNDFIGAMGLGSKSPFCYVQGFDVTSRKGGKLRIYNAYIDENGTPNILLQLEEDTKEPDGVEVKFPVLQDDVYEFKNKAANVFEFFSPKPKFNVKLDIVKREYVMKSETWGIRKTDYSLYGLRAIQGMVPYTVGTIDTSKMNEIQRSVWQLGLDMFFGIGELSVAASRETLSNDDRTLKAILSKLEDIGKNLTEEMKKQVGEKKTKWEAQLLIHNMALNSGIGDVIYNAFKEGKLDGQYPNFSLKFGEPSIDESDYLDISFARFKKSSSAAKWANKRDKGHSEADRIATINSPSYKKSYLNLSFEVSSGVIFLINDVGFGVDKFIHYFLQQDDDTTQDVVYLINRIRKDVPITKVITEGKKVIAELGNPPYKLVSELEKKYGNKFQKVGTATSTGILVPRGEVQQFIISSAIKKERDGYESKRWRNGWHNPTGPLPSTVYYVTTKRGEPTSGKFNFAEDFGSFIKNVQESGICAFTESDSVYGINEISPYRHKPGWTEFTSYVFTELKKYMTPTVEQELSLMFNPFDPRLEKDYLRHITSKLDLSSPMLKFCKDLAVARAHIGQRTKQSLAALGQLIDKANLLGKYAAPNTANFKVRWEQLMKIYPMLKYTEQCYWGIEKEDLLKYIQLADKESDHVTPKDLTVPVCP